MTSVSSMTPRFDVITLFPDMFSVVRDLGVTGRAHRQGIWSLGLWNPRDFTHDVHRTVDDRPYGGGPGMVMLANPLEQAVNAARKARMASSPVTDVSAPVSLPSSTSGISDAVSAGSLCSGAAAVPVILLSPVGKPFTQSRAQALADGAGAILVCGRYEGIDQRFIDRCVTEEISLGDFVLSGGEIAALAVMDATLRLLPGVLNDSESARQDSFNEALTGLLDSPHYTRPEIYEGQAVPPELLSGHHAHIAQWRRRQSLTLTFERRPDLLERARASGLLSVADEHFLAGLESPEKGSLK